MQLQNKIQSLDTYTMTVPRVRGRGKVKILNNITENREEISERRLPGDDLYFPPDVN